MRTAERFFAAKTLESAFSSDPTPPNSLPMAQTRTEAARSRGRADPRARVDNALREADDRETTRPSLSGAARGIIFDATARARLATHARPSDSAVLGAWHAMRIAEVSASLESKPTISALVKYKWQPLRISGRFMSSRDSYQAGLTEPGGPAVW